MSICPLLIFEILQWFSSTFNIFSDKIHFSLEFSFTNFPCSMKIQIQHSPKILLSLDEQDRGVKSSTGCFLAAMLFFCHEHETTNTANDRTAHYSFPDIFYQILINFNYFLHPHNLDFIMGICSLCGFGHLLFRGPLFLLC